MNLKKANSQRLQRILAQAHQRETAGTPQPGPAWRTGLMRNIDGLQATPRRGEQWEAMTRMVWRLVPAAGAVALVLAILLSATPPQPATQLASLMTADSGDLGLYSYYNGETYHE